MVLKSIWSAKWYLLLGLISYLIFLIITAPLSYVWPQVKPYLGPLPVSVERVQGTLWQGLVQLREPRLGAIVASWDMNVNELLVGNIAASMKVKGDQLSFKGIVSASKTQVNIEDAKAFLSAKHLQPLLQQGRSSLTGDFELSKFSGIFSLENQQIVAADGRLLFTGGDVSFPLDGKTVSSTLPILTGLIQKPRDNVEVLIANTDGEKVGDGYVQPDGWAGISIRRRFLDILGLQWPANVAADKVIFEASQKLL